MTTTTRIFLLSAIIALLLAACNIGNIGGTAPDFTGDPATQLTPQPTPPPPLTMTVTYEKDGLLINYSYLIVNTGGTPAPGPMVVTDDKVQVICPEITSVGNGDNNLDANESLTCSGSYTITQADIDAGSVTTFSSASASGYVSAGVPTTVLIEQTLSLSLSKSPDPQTFNSVGQAIIYSFVITNNGAASLGPAQFTITDDKIGAAINCGSGGTILPPGGTVTCSATYLTTQADLNAGSVTNTAYASDGTTNSNPVTATITRSGTNGGTPPSNLTPGSDITHTVVAGEWLWQIARCYGAAPKQVIATNPQIPVPADITPGITVTVPDIGSNGAIFGPPCVILHTVQAGDTWNSIAGQYTNIDVNLLQEANLGGLVPGTDIKVPVGPFSYP